MKQPYIAFYTGDWLKDTKLSLCSLATRGLWIDLICNLHEFDHGGSITANAEQIARICRCTVADADAAISELRTYGVADVNEREGRLTIVCRRMKRAADLTIKRQQAGSKRYSKTEARPEYESEDEVKTEIEKYCSSIGLPTTDGTAVYEKWKGNGWTNGGKPIRDWKATIRSWQLHSYLPSQKQKVGPNGFQKPKQPDPRQDKLDREYEAAMERRRQKQ